MELRGALRKKIDKKRENRSPPRREPGNDIDQRREEIRRRREQLREEEQRLRDETRQRRTQRRSQDEPEPVRIIYHKGKGDWLLDIFTIVFVVGVFLNSGLSAPWFETAADHRIMQSWLLFAILMQAIKIGKKI